MLFLPYLANSVRQRANSLRNKYQTVYNAESMLGLTIDKYMGKDSPSSSKKIVQSIQKNPSYRKMLALSTRSEKIAVIKELFHTLEINDKITCCSEIFLKENCKIKQMLVSYVRPVLLKDDFIDWHETIKFIDEAFLQLAIKKGVTSNPRHFASISIKAMQRLQLEKKPNLVYKFSEMLTLQKCGNPAEPVIQLGRMPFGLIEYVIQFFVTHVKQVIVLYVTVTHLY